MTMTQQQVDERLLKLAQVAALANVSSRTIQRDRRKGALEVVIVMIGGVRRVRVRLSEARRYAGLA